MKLMWMHIKKKQPKKKTPHQKTPPPTPKKHIQKTSAAHSQSMYLEWNSQSHLHWVCSYSLFSLVTQMIEQRLHLLNWQTTSLVALQIILEDKRQTGKMVSEKKDEMPNTARRQEESKAETLNVEQLAKEKFHWKRERLCSIYELVSVNSIML